MERKPRPDVQETPEYTTEEERPRGEDVKNSTKLDVLQRASRSWYVEDSKVTMTIYPFIQLVVCVKWISVHDPAVPKIVSGF